MKPIKKLVTPNDKLAKIIFMLGEDYSKFFADVPDSLKIKEGVKWRCYHGGSNNGGKSFKLEIVSTEFTLSLDEKGLDAETIEQFKAKPLDAFDRAVHAATNTCYLAGIKHVTVGMIYRLITGKPAGKMQTPTAEQARAIRESIDKMRRLSVKIISTNLYESFETYNGGKKPVLPNAQILPCRFGDNNEIELLGESPLSIISKAKNNQLVIVEAANLNIGRSHSSRLIVGAKFYCAARIMEIIGHSKELKPAITLDDVLDKCNVDARAVKRRELDAAKRALEMTFANFKRSGMVDTYEFMTDDFFKKKFKFTFQKPPVEETPS